jgi:ABC-2 type transport system permease protein
VAVYERTYRSYSGELTPGWSRFLVLPRYAYQTVFQSRLFVAFLVACFVWPLVLAVLIYLPHNLRFLEMFQLQTADITSIFKYDAGFFFYWFMVPYQVVAFFMAFIVGPPLISVDLRNNGLPLYLSRPFSRSEYLLGKSAVMLILLSAVTWVPGLVLFAFQSYLAGFGYFREHFTVGISIFVAFWIWILILCLLTLAISAYVKWKPVARVALFVVWFVFGAFGLVVNLLLRTTWGSLIDIGGMIQVVWAGMFGIESPVQVPLWAAWASLLVVCGVCIALLSRKVRAYEVVR